MIGPPPSNNQPHNIESLKMAKKPESKIFDPEKYLVGKVDPKKFRKLGDGVYELARDERSGVHLWGRILDGAALCMRFTNAGGDLLETYTIFKPYPNDVPQPTPEFPRPFPCSGDPRAEGSDGGIPCKMYVCTANSDGGQTCFLVPC